MRMRSPADVGPLARQRRVDLGMSQQEVAEQAGVTRQWLVRFEQGNAEVTLSKAFGVLRALGMIFRVDAEGSRNGDEATATAAFTIPRADLSTMGSPVAPAHDELLAAMREKIAALDAPDSPDSGATERDR